MSNIVGPYHPLCLTSGHDCWNASPIPVWFLSEITSLLRLNYWYPGLLLVTNMCHTRSVCDKTYKALKRWQSPFLVEIKLSRTQLWLEEQSGLSEVIKTCQLGWTDSLRSHKAQPNYTQHTASFTKAFYLKILQNWQCGPHYNIWLTC